MAEIRFGEFRLDPAERLLRRGDERVELSGRYLDALALMVREPGRLIGKERFHDEVWRGVPVTDEALTQCIRSLRRALGDKAEQPRFIETVPKHGYRFIAPVSGAASDDLALQSVVRGSGSDLPWLFGAGLVGAGLAGLVGGLIYGLAATSGDMGAASVLTVLISICVLTALLGGAGIVGGMLAAERMAGRGSGWTVAGAGLGGLIVGTLTKLLGLDAFNLLLGRAPAGVSGGFEGLLVGAGVGVGCWLVERGDRISLTRAALFGLASGTVAGLAIGLTGHGLMVASLDSLAQTMPGSRLRLDELGRLAGEHGLGAVTRTIITTAESALFAGGIVVALTLARRQLHAR